MFQCLELCSLRARAAALVVHDSGHVRQVWLRFSHARLDGGGSVAMQGQVEDFISLLLGMWLSGLALGPIELSLLGGD